MKNLKTLILVRHADYEDLRGDPGLTLYGKTQSLKLTESIKSVVGINDVTIWTSSARRAKETADIIKQEMPFASFMVEEKLWSDDNHDKDFYWLKEKLEKFDGEHLIIVSHLEYVRQFPTRLGYPMNKAGYACGVLIKDGKCTDFC